MTFEVSHDPVIREYRRALAYALQKADRLLFSRMSFQKSQADNALNELEPGLRAVAHDTKMLTAATDDLRIAQSAFDQLETKE